jgi:monofunctional biosynthetic peptidoglycan transglycosylase
MSILSRLFRVAVVLWISLLWFISLFPFRLPLMVIPLKTALIKENSFSHDWEVYWEYSVNLQKVIASEDGSFLIHNGFDFKAMQKAGNERGRK